MCFVVDKVYDKIYRIIIERLSLQQSFPLKTH